MNPISKLTVLLMVIALPIVSYAQVAPRNPVQRQHAPAVAIHEHPLAHDQIIAHPPANPEHAVFAVQPEFAVHPQHAPEHPVAYHPARPSAVPAIHPQPEREVYS